MSQPSVLRFQSLEDFRCIQDRCENTCCGKWNIHIDDDTRERWASSYVNIYEVIATDAQDTLPLNDAGECKFLDAGKCGVQKNYGVGAIPKVCDKYPREYVHINQAEIQLVYPSCPEAARKIFLSKDAFRLIEKGKNAATTPTSVIASDNVSIDVMKDIFERLFEHFLSEEYRAEQLLYSFLTTIRDLNEIPMVDWLKTIDAKAHLDVDSEEYFGELPRLGYSDAVLLVNEVASSNYSFLAPFNNVLRKGVGQALDEIKHNHSQRTKPESFAALYPAETKFIDSWLKRHLAVTIANVGLPFRSQSAEGRSEGKTPMLWARRIALDFIFVRFCLQSLVIHGEQNSLSEALMIDILHRIYRVLFHVRLNDAETVFLKKEYGEVIEQLFYVR